MAAEEELTQAESREIAAKIREHLARRRMSRQQLADEARISISTLEKALGGTRPFTLATLVRLEGALGATLRKARTGAKQAPAPANLGSYSHASVAWLEGDYLTLRPSFGMPGAIYAYRTGIRWDETLGCLAFQEAERLDAPYAQKGVVAVPTKSAQIYLHTNDEGQMRLAVLDRPLITGQMYGILTTLESAKGGQLVPVAVPFALVPPMPDMVFGRIAPSDKSFARYREHLDRVLADDFARFVTI